MTLIPLWLCFSVNFESYILFELCSWCAFINNALHSTTYKEITAFLHNLIDPQHCFISEKKTYCWNFYIIFFPIWILEFFLLILYVYYILTTASLCLQYFASLPASFYFYAFCERPYVKNTIWNQVHHYMRWGNAVKDFKKQPLIFSDVDICSGHWRKTGHTQICLCLLIGDKISGNNQWFFLVDFFFIYLT